VGFAFFFYCEPGPFDSSANRLEYFADAVFIPWRCQQMDVVGHPDVGMDLQSMFFRGFNKGVAEGLVVSLGGKNNLAVIAALDDVLGLAGYDVTGKTGHDCGYWAIGNTAIPPQ